MQVTSLRIKNFLSIGDVEIRPGRITQITGQNNQGKTSIIKALDFAVHGSNDPSVVKIGEDAAEVLVELSDNTSIRRRLSSEGRQSVSVERDGMKAKAPQALLDALFDPSSFNPLELLTAKNRTEAILRSIDLKVTASQLAEDLKVEVEHLPPLDFDQHGLKIIEQARMFFYQRRAEANRDADTKAARLATYKKDLTPMPPLPEMNRMDLQVRKNGISAAIKEAEEMARSINRQHVDAEKARQKVTQYVNEATKIDEFIQELERNLQAARARRETAQSFIMKAEAEVPKDLPTTAAQEEAIAVGRAEIQKVDLVVKDWDAIDQIAKQHEMIKTVETEARSAALFAEALTQKVDALHGPIRKKLMESAEMPIKGLEYVEGVFTVDGIAVDNLSTSAALKLAIAVARKVAKKMKIICIDGAEQLDEANWKLLCEEIHGDGFMYVVTRVGEAMPGGQVVKMDHGAVVQ